MTEQPAPEADKPSLARPRVSERQKRRILACCRMIEARRFREKAQKEAEEINLRNPHDTEPVN